MGRKSSREDEMVFAPVLHFWDYLSFVDKQFSLAFPSDFHNFHWLFFQIMRTSYSSREQVTEDVRAQKVRLGLKWAQVAEELGQSKEWTTAACLGQMQLNGEEAAKLVKIFQLAPEASQWLQMAPNKGNNSATVSPTDPLLYRFQEHSNGQVINVYGETLRELIHEEFGDGIMSAIDFKLNLEREPNDQGDRVKLIWSGKFLPYKRF